MKSLELVYKNLVTAGVSIPDEDLAMTAINVLKTDPRYQGSTKAYEAVLITSQPADQFKSYIVCYHCGENGYIARDCPKDLITGEKRLHETAFAHIQDGDSEYEKALRKSVRLQLYFKSSVSNTGSIYVSICFVYLL